MEKTLYIHIGTPKTGSTAIQGFLDINKDRFYDDGYIYREMPLGDYVWSIPVKDDNGNLIIQEKTTFNPRLRNGYFLHGTDGDPDGNVARLEKGFDILSDWFKEKPNIILTDELIYREFNKWNYLERIRDFSAIQGIRVKIIVFLRRQDDYLDSYYRERIKKSYRTDTWEQFLKQITETDELHIKYPEALRAFSDCFGMDNLKVIPYDPDNWRQNGESIFSVFLKAINIQDSTESYKLPSKTANEKNTCNQTEMMRILNKLAKADKPLERSTKLLFRRACIECSALNPEEKKQSYMSDDERCCFINDYEEGNRRIAMDYLGREELFAPGPSDTERWEYDPTAMQKDMILFFGIVTKELHEEVKALEDRRISVKNIKKLLYRVKQRMVAFIRR